MYLSDRDLRFAVETGQLIVDPPPEEYDTTSIDLHLDKVEEAKIWNVRAYREKQAQSGSDPWLRVGKYRFQLFSREFYEPVPTDPAPENAVYRIGSRVIIRPQGFLLWQTREAVGTPEIDPDLLHQWQEFVGTGRPPGPYDRSDDPCGLVGADHAGDREPRPLRSLSR